MSSTQDNAPSSAQGVDQKAAAGCPVGPNYKRPATPEPAAFANATAVVTSNAQFNAEWWRSFNDPLLENLIARGKCNPRLLAAGPDVPGWPQPRRIIEAACTHADHAVPGQAANPGAAFRTD